MSVQTITIIRALTALLLSSSCIMAEDSVTDNASNSPCQQATNSVDLITKTGVKYKNASVLRVEADSLVIRHSVGIANVPLDQVSDELQQHYGYDPAAAAEKRTQQAAVENARRAADQAPLEGQDLVAWKLARQAAEAKCKEMMSHFMAGNWDARAMSYMRTIAPTYEVAAVPQRRFMKNTDTGDWMFVIPLKTSHYNKEKEARLPGPLERMLVKVTNYGAEIRVEEVRHYSE